MTSSTPKDGQDQNKEKESLNQVSLKDFLLYFLHLGSFGFGGPIVLTGHMQRDLVENKKWISDQDFVEGVALAQLAPGPLAAQLAIYLGWVRASVWGATLVGIAFILPSFIIVLLISFLYLRFGGLKQFHVDLSTQLFLYNLKNTQRLVARFMGNELIG